MRAVYINEFIENTLTVTTENANYPKENLQNRVLARVYKSTSATSQRLAISGSNISPQYLFIFQHNLSINSEVYLQATNGADWTDIQFSETILINGDPAYHKISDPDALSWQGQLYGEKLYGDALYGEYTDFDTYTFDKWSLLITDPHNTDIEIGLVVLGAYIDLPEMSPDQDLSTVTESEVAISDSGQAYGDLKYDYRAPVIKQPFYTEDMRTDIATMWAEVKNVVPFVLMIWPEDFDVEPPLYCVFDSKKNPIKKNPGNRMYPYNTSLKFREVF